MLQLLYATDKQNTVYGMICPARLLSSVRLP